MQSIYTPPAGLTRGSMDGRVEPGQGVGGKWLNLSGNHSLVWLLEPRLAKAGDDVINGGFIGEQPS